MHKYTINASIQMVPVATVLHPYEWVDQVLEIIKQSGLPYEVGPFCTSVEGSYLAVSELIDRINEYLITHQCEEWLLQVQWHIRANENITANEKTMDWRGNN